MKRFLLLLLLPSLACRSAGVAPAHEAEPKAKVELVTISPAPMTNLKVNPMLVAEVKYEIEGYLPDVDYYLAPLFASNEGSDTTFNEFDRLTEGQRLASPSGTVTIRYSAHRELNSPQLAQPVKVWFYLMERTGAHTTRVIAKTEPVVYTSAG
jgi:hypothetical protein